MDSSREGNHVSTVDKGRRRKWLRRSGSTRTGFRYFRHDKTRVTDTDTLERIKTLAIPPAWRQVRICPAPSGKIQAVGIDARGRIQYRYSQKFAAAQNRKKFARIEEFGKHLPDLYRATNQHIALSGFPMEKVLAIMTRLMNSLYIRMGSDKSEKEFRTYGITTLRKKHVAFDRAGKVTFEFVGKSYIKHRRVLVDPEFSALLKELSSVGRGGKLFKYIDGENKLRPVKPTHINQYIKSLTAPEFSAKDFRTWGATVRAAAELATLGAAADSKSAQANIVKAVKRVAELLGNTPAVCRNSYIHPALLRAYEKGVDLSPLVIAKTDQCTCKFPKEMEQLGEQVLIVCKENS